MLFDESKMQSEFEMIELEFKDAIGKLRTGRLTREVFEGVFVEAYGTKMPLNGVATLSFEGTSVLIRPFDKGVIKNIQDAISASNLGLSLVPQGDELRANAIPMTQELRVEQVTKLNRLLEDHRVKARKVRQEFMEDVKGLEGVSEDEQERSQKRIQAILDGFIKKLEEISEDKEKDIMSI